MEVEFRRLAERGSAQGNREEPGVSRFRSEDDGDLAEPGVVSVSRVLRTLGVDSSE